MWADEPGFNFTAGASVWCWYQDSKYKIKQKYFAGPGKNAEWPWAYATSYSSFESACSQVDSRDWKTLIPAVQNDPEYFREWTRWPRLIDIDKVAPLVTPWNFYWHGDGLNPAYGNEILYDNGFYGAEFSKQMITGNTVYYCLAALAVGVRTGYLVGGAISPNPDEAEAYVWEWQC
jgi:hypothetical protein